MEQVLVEVNKVQDWKKEILEFSEEQKYVISHVDIFGPCEDMIGELQLKNIVTNEIEKYAIWMGSDDLSLNAFYVCIPNTVKEIEEEGMDEYEDYSIDVFPIPRHYYSNLQWETE